MGSSQVHSQLFQKIFTSYAFQNIKKGIPKGQHIFHQVESGAIIYSDAFASYVPPAHIQSRLSIHPEIFPAYLSPAYAWSRTCCEGADGSRNFCRRVNTKSFYHLTVVLTRALYLLGRLSSLICLEISSAMQVWISGGRQHLSSYTFSSWGTGGHDVSISSTTHDLSHLWFWISSEKMFFNIMAMVNLSYQQWKHYMSSLTSDKMFVIFVRIQLFYLFNRIL